MKVTETSDYHSIIPMVFRCVHNPAAIRRIAACEQARAGVRTVDGRPANVLSSAHFRFFQHSALSALIRTNGANSASAAGTERSRNDAFQEYEAGGG